MILWESGDPQWLMRLHQAGGRRPRPPSPLSGVSLCGIPAVKMKTPIRVLALLLLAASVPGLGAGLERYKDWTRSPEFVFLATDAEQKEWKKITTDEQADKFVQLFWAKRDPDLKTPVNEYKLGFDQRVKEADQLFAMPRQRGALTERGKAYILLGPPKTLQRFAGTKTQPTSAPGSANIPPPNEPGTSIGESKVTFVYEAAQLPEWAKMKSLIAEFVVEQASDFAAGRQRRRQAPRGERPRRSREEPRPQGGAALPHGRRARGRAPGRARRRGRGPEGTRADARDPDLARERRGGFRAPRGRAPGRGRDGRHAHPGPDLPHRGRGRAAGREPPCVPRPDPGRQGRRALRGGDAARARAGRRPLREPVVLGPARRVHGGRRRLRRVREGRRRGQEERLRRGRAHGLRGLAPRDRERVLRRARIRSPKTRSRSRATGSSPRARASTRRTASRSSCASTTRPWTPRRSP